MSTTQVLTLQVDGPAAVIYGVPEWVQEKARLTPSRDVISALAKLVVLSKNSLEAVGGMSFIGFPLRGRAGFFEVRVNGIRFYGTRVATLQPNPPKHLQERALLILLGAESKAGKRSADSALLDACTARLKSAASGIDAVKNNKGMQP
jgi:hypothetical protein